MGRILGLLGLTLAAAVAAPPSAAAGEPVLAVGKPAPPLSLTAADGTTRTLAGLGRPVVVVFFRGLW